MGKWLEDIVEALENLGGVAEYADLYREIKKIRPAPLPITWDAIIRQVVESHSSDSANFNGRDIFYSVEGLGKGVWGLRKLLTSTPIASDIEEPSGPVRVKCETYRILRDTALARQLKMLHQNCCQLCGEGVPLAEGKVYSEAHHLKPLGRPHNGPDIAANIIVLCPNHPVQCDYGAVMLDTVGIRFHPKHKVGAEYLEYHNKSICMPKAAT